MNNKHNPHNLASYSVLRCSDSAEEFSAAAPRGMVLRPLAVALRWVLGGGVLAAGLIGPALGQNQGPVLSPVTVPNQSQGLDLSALDGGDGFALNGVAAYDSSGWSVSGAGDVNGDGFDDVIIASPFNDFYPGQSYVVFGTPSASGPSALLEALLADVEALGLPAGLEHWLAERCGDVFNGSGLCSGSRSFQRPKPTPPTRGVY